jgi:hypothetical protein
MGSSLPEKTLELSIAAQEALEFWPERPFSEWMVGNWEGAR